MVELMRWDPFGETTSLRDVMDRLLEESFILPPRFRFDGSGGVPIDMYQTANDVVVSASLPGFKPEEVDISITGDNLLIKGAHKEEKEINEEDYFYRERRHGDFTRLMRLPMEVNGDKAEAVYEDGVLTLTLPKVEEIKPKQIKVKTTKMLPAGKK